MMGPDGALYVTTSNGGGNDRILRIAENLRRCFRPAPVQSDRWPRTPVRA